jgi:hypothetical protein
MRDFLIGIACIAVLIVILSLGLWPFHAPRNDAAWLKERNGVRFSGKGTAISTAAFEPFGSPAESGCSIEIWVEPFRRWDKGTILCFHSPAYPVRFSLQQSLTDLLLESGGANGMRVRGEQGLYVNDVFRRKGPVFLTITSGEQGTAVYMNGALARTAPKFRLAAGACAGRLILGSAPLQPGAWRGQVRGLAIYRSELRPAAVLRHFGEWTQDARPQISSDENNVGLYLFDERAGNLIHNRARPGIDLFMPERYTVLDKSMLEPFWDEFGMSQSYGESVVKNIVGFVPLGFCFFAYLSLVRRAKHAQLVTVLLGAAVSVTIEVLQCYLPTRESGTTDIFTNTLGTYLGVLLYKAVSPTLTRVLARLGSLDAAVR